MGINGNSMSISCYANDMPEFNGNGCGTLMSNNPVIIFFDNSNSDYKPEWVLGDDASFY